MLLFVEGLAALLLLLGAVFLLVGALGLARFPDLYTRLHGPTKCATLGVGGIALGSLLHFAVLYDALPLNQLLLILFLFLTAPVSAYLVAKAAMHLDTKPVDRTQGSPWRQ